MGTTLTCPTDTPKIRLVWSRSAKCPWLLAQIVTVSSVFQRAVAECGSMYPW